MRSSFWQEIGCLATNGCTSIRVRRSDRRNGRTRRGDGSAKAAPRCTGEDMTVGRKLASGFAVALLFLFVIGGVAYDNTSKLLDARQRVAHTNDVLAALDHLIAGLVDAETGQRGFLLTHEDSYLEPYRSALTALQQFSLDLDRLVVDSPKQQARAFALKP